STGSLRPERDLWGVARSEEVRYAPSSGGSVRPPTDAGRSRGEHRPSQADHRDRARHDPAARPSDADAGARARARRTDAARDPRGTARFMSANVSLAPELTVGATTEPIVAWRAWALTGHRDGTELLLRPVAGRSRPWRPMEPAEAACKHARLHGAPNVDCSCGLHGTHDVEILRRTRCPAVLGRVAFWGRVIEHE